MLEGLFKAALAASESRQEQYSSARLEETISKIPGAIDAYSALSGGTHMRVIAEIKRRSPSKGFLAEIPDTGAQAKIYQAGGASAISVLTEGTGFGGSLEDLKLARAAVDLPLLRKDFIQNEYQILEARAAGADFILLILAWLPKARYEQLMSFSLGLGMQVLVETHTVAEVEVAASSGAKIIGINTRNLETFETDIGLFEKMSGLLPQNSVKVAESSVRDVRDVERYAAAGADCVLVGEALVRGNALELLELFTAVKA